MALEDDLRPSYMRAADGMIGLLSDTDALKRVAEEDPSRCMAFHALEIRDLFGPHYLQVQVGIDSADLMDGYSSEAGEMGSGLPTKGQARMIAGFLAEGPRRATEEVRSIIDALVKAGASRSALLDEVDLAFVRSVMES